MACEKPILGMIAGNGILPVLVARGAKAVDTASVVLAYAINTIRHSQVNAIHFPSQAWLGSVVGSAY